MPLDDDLQAVADAGHCSLSREQLISANRRLNRRCQKAESDLLRLQANLQGAINVMREEGYRVNKATSRLREIYTYHENQPRRYWVKCWCCRFRRWWRRKLWDRYFAIK